MESHVRPTTVLCCTEHSQMTVFCTKKSLLRRGLQLQTATGMRLVCLAKRCAGAIRRASAGRKLEHEEDIVHIVGLVVWSRHVSGERDAQASWCP